MGMSFLPVIRADTTQIANAKLQMQMNPTGLIYPPIPAAAPEICQQRQSPGMAG
eukprot:CAMPEP_0185576030 /NCGR_PEP_ID=MMETSP0434-20130131/7058_1 /TAXON_ID=626734 ORGANISM="Favella taraikaensis, Strain Fe Narragansett Bay" /NCGR_SAMPLE_ID=MMETSP0434 /ASSEMBLY_ACC=CAM_ASM_000379 /LENGTH=53 /DNA_ID=CAMNT_0028193089 /DNA_START=139 /DNA_END=300 /DNA_ORIENTATION=+